MPSVEISTEVRQSPRRDLVHIAALDERLDQLPLDQLLATLFDVPGVDVHLLKLVVRRRRLLCKF